MRVLHEKQGSAEFEFPAITLVSGFWVVVLVYILVYLISFYAAMKNSTYGMATRIMV